MKKIQSMNVAELAAFVCSHLLKNGIKCVLTGGACVSIYSENKYESFDLDFIDNSFTPRKAIAAILEEIGFIEKDRYFINKETKYLVEFPAGPLSIGSQPVKDIHELEFKTGKLFILSPTDSVKDRLASYYYWDDKQALEQAKLLFNAQKIDLYEIEKWSKEEGQTAKFNNIKKIIFSKK